MEVYLAVTPGKVREVRAPGCKLAHVAYRIDGMGRLTRRESLPFQGGLMALSDRGGAIRDGDALCRMVVRECVGRNFSGVLADFEEPVSQNTGSFLARLRQALERGGRRLYVPRCYAPQVPGARVLICTAISGGNLRRYLEEACGQYGTEGVALDLQRLRMVFPLPCPEGRGTPIAQQELQKLMEEHSPAVFHSPDLGAKYFTYARAEGSFLCLFDTAETIRAKLRLGRELGIGAAFLMYPEVKDLLGELFRQ